MNTTNHTSPSGEELKPCPFCGGKAVFSRNEFHGDDSMAVCSCCGATAFWRKWNGRADSRAQPSGEDVANGAIGEREAFEAWFRDECDKRNLGVGDEAVARSGWQAALTAEKVAAEPIYQVLDPIEGGWSDGPRSLYDATDGAFRRIVYAAPQQPAQSAEQDERALTEVGFIVHDDLHGWHFAPTVAWTYLGKGRALYALATETNNADQA